MPPATEARAKVYLDMPVNYLKGVGPARAEALRRLGIVTARDLLFHIPHRYEDASTISPIASLEPGMDGTIIGRVISKGIIPTRKGLRIFQAVLKDASGMIEVVARPPFLDRTIEKGDIMLLTGPVRSFTAPAPAAQYIQPGKDDDGVEGGKCSPSILQRRALLKSFAPSSTRTSIRPALSGVPARRSPGWLGSHRCGRPQNGHRPQTMLRECREDRACFRGASFVHVLHRARIAQRQRRSGIAFQNAASLPAH